MHGLRYLGSYLDGNGAKRRRPNSSRLAFPTRSCHTMLHTLPLRACFALVPNDEVGGPTLPLVGPVHAVCSACAAAPKRMTETALTETTLIDCLFREGPGPTMFRNILALHPCQVAHTPIFRWVVSCKPKPYFPS